MAIQDLNLYSYKIEIGHKIKPEFLQGWLKSVRLFSFSTPGIEKRFIASYEAYFYLNTVVNNQNFRIWDDFNSYFVPEKPLCPESETLSLFFCKYEKNMWAYCRPRRILYWINYTSIKFAIFLLFIFYIANSRNSSSSSIQEKQIFRLFMIHPVLYTGLRISSDIHIIDYKKKETKKDTIFRLI